MQCSAHGEVAYSFIFDGFWGIMYETFSVVSGDFRVEIEQKNNNKDKDMLMEN